MHHVLEGLKFGAMESSFALENKDLTDTKFLSLSQFFFKVSTIVKTAIDIAKFTKLLNKKQILAVVLPSQIT
jgi:hypothetical protein